MGWDGMACFLPECRNNSTHNPDITFVPIRKSLKQKWCRVVGRNCPKRTLYCCERHLNLEKDLENFMKWKMMGGTPKLSESAILQNVNIPDDTSVADETPTSTCNVDTQQLCCRICLSTHSKLISMESYGLRTAYEQVTGVSVEHDDGLPRELCVECATLLLKYNKFRNKTHMAYGFLNNMHMKNYNDIVLQVNEIKRLRLELDKVHSPLKYSDFIVHLDIKPDSKITTDEISTNIDDKINCQDRKNHLIDKIETIDSMTDMDDDYYEDVKVDDDEWTQSDFIVETKDKIVDIMVRESSDSSHVDKKNVESKKIKLKKKIKNIKEFHPFKTNKNDDVIVYNYDSLTDSSHINEEGKARKKMKPKNKNETMEKIESFINDDKKTEKLNKKLNKLLQKDDSSETFLENLKKKNCDSKITVRNCEIFKKRHALVNECFDKKTMLSLEEQRDSFEKMKLEDSYVKAKYKCELCYKGLVTEQYLHNHIKKYHSETLGKYICQLCKWRYKKEKLLLVHMKRAHVYEYQCKSCDATFTNLVRAESHAKYHKGIEFVCQHCGKQFKGYTVYLTHVRTAHPSDYVCIYCGYSFIGELGLNQHVKKVHKEQAEFAEVPCKSCEFKFVSEQALAAHVRIKHPETDQKPMYNDRQCGTRRRNTNPIRKRVVRNTEYRRKNIATIQFPVPCEACGLELSSGSDYKIHFAKEHPYLKRTFLVSRFYPHMCDKCGRGFQAPAVLQDHLLTHGSEYTIQCPKCNMKFKSTQQMKTHLYSHEEPLECHICGANITKRNMQRHLVMKHSEVKSFKCDLCGKCFKTKGEVRTHMKHVHMNIPWPRKRKDGPPLRKRRKVQKHTGENETEESNNAGFNDSNE